VGTLAVSDGLMEISLRCAAVAHKRKYHFIELFILDGITDAGSMLQL